MRRPCLLIVTLLTLAPTAGWAQQYSVDPAHTSVVFSVGHMGYSYTYGLFRETGGAVRFDAANPKACRFDLMVKVASINTGNDKRDQHLLAPDFFDAQKHPEITFTGSPVAVKQDDKGRSIYQVVGKLTMHGVTKEAVLPMRLLNVGQNREGKPMIGFHCEFSLNRSDYGMSTSLGPITDSIGVTFSFEAVAK